MSSWTVALSVVMIIIMMAALWFAYATFKKTKHHHERNAARDKVGKAVNPLLESVERLLWTFQHLVFPWEKQELRHLRFFETTEAVDDFKVDEESAYFLARLRLDIRDHVYTPPFDIDLCEELLGALPRLRDSMDEYKKHADQFVASLNTFVKDLAGFVQATASTPVMPGSLAYRVYLLANRLLVPRGTLDMVITKFAMRTGSPESANAYRWYIQNSESVVEALNRDQTQLSKWVSLLEQARKIRHLLQNIKRELQKTKTRYRRTYGLRKAELDV